MISALKKTWLITFIFLFPTVAVSDQLTFTTGDWRPYIFESQGTVDANKPGSSIEIVNTVFTALGHDITYKTAPFLRQLKETGQGKYLALVGVYKEEAPHLLFPKEPIAMTQNCFYTRSDNQWNYNNLIKQLSAVTIAVIDGYTYGEIDSYITKEEKNIIKLTGNETDMMSRLVELLDFDRATAFVQDTMVAKHFFKHQGIEGQYRTAGCLEAIPSMIGFAPNAPKSLFFANAFDAQIKKLRESGELGKILSKYDIVDWK